MIGDDIQQHRRRGRVLFACCAVVLAFLVLRVAQLQVARHDVLHRIGEQNRLRPLTVQPTRGRIYDRQARILVDNRPSWTVFVTPVGGVGQERVIAELAGILETPSESMRERMRQRRGYQYTALPVMRDVSFDAVAHIRERALDLPGVTIQMEPRRRYPFGTLAAHVLGTLREIDEADLTERQRQGQDYLFGDMVGKRGLELTEEETLRGTRGVEYVEVDAHGRVVREVTSAAERPPRHGRDLLTTLDIDLQLAAESAFHDTARGAVVALDPRDGAVLVLASVPGFDPLDFSGVLDTETWNRLTNDPDRPLLNRAVAGLYPPASTLKVLTALAGLQQGVITPTTRLDPCVPGGWALGNRPFQCWSPGHGSLMLVEALEQSCDVYFYQVGVRTGLKPLHDLAVQFGLGHRVGIDLPDELAGSFPDDGWYNRRLGTGRWNESSQVINLAIGQGEILATPLQVAVMTAVVANGGERVTPFLVREVLEPADGTLQPRSHEPSQPIPGLDSQDLAVVRAGMEAVSNGEHGTARWLAPRLPGIRVAGKTGTGQNPHGEDHAWFTCYAPAEAPEIVVTVLVENGGGGSTVAAPIAFEVLQAWARTRPSVPATVVGEGGVR